MIKNFNPHFNLKSKTETDQAVRDLKHLLKEELKKPENQDRYVADGDRVTLTGVVSVDLANGASLTFGSGYTPNYGPQDKVYDGTSFDNDPRTDDSIHVSYWAEKLPPQFQTFDLQDSAKPAPWWKPFSPDQRELSVKKFSHETFGCGIGGSGGSYHLGSETHNIVV